MAKVESFQKYRRREAARELKKRERATLRELRHKIRALHARRRSTLTEIRHGCRAERQRVSADVRQLREATKIALRERVQEMREAQRGTCNIRKANARNALGAELARAADELGAERARQAEGKRAELEQRKRDRAGRSSSAERRQEADDEVRANLPAELVAVFDKVKRSIKPRPRMSRTEAFLHWAEENPDEVLKIQSDAGERAWMRELAELEREHKRLAKAYRRRPKDDEELAKRLAGVPF